MKKKMKKPFSLFVALCMIISLFPMAAFAEPSTDPLKPAAQYYAFNGKSASQSDADITLSKTAVDNKNGTYTVTLSADADQMVMAKKTEVVFVIDGSGSMNWCEEKATEDDDAGWISRDHYHTNIGSVYCNYVQQGKKDSRWDIALNAIKTMKEKLGEAGVFYKYVVYPKSKGGTGSVYSSLETLRNSESPSGGTYLSAAVNTALKQFSGDDTNKVMIIVSDGASDDRYPKDTERVGKEEKLTDFGKFKENGGEVYTVGFTFSNDDFGAISSEPHKDYNFYATDAASLNLTMDKISENIKGLITDPMGEKVQLVGGADGVTVSPFGSPAAWVVGDTMNWTNTQGLNGKVTLSYTVKVKDSQVQAGHNTIDLNGDATLNYTIGQDGE